MAKADNFKEDLARLLRSYNAVIAFNHKAGGFTVSVDAPEMIPLTAEGEGVVTEGTIVGLKEEDTSVSLSFTSEDLGIERTAVEDGLEDAISEAISDKTGFCHMGFSYRICVDAELDKSE